MKKMRENKIKVKRRYEKTTDTGKKGKEKTEKEKKRKVQ